MRAEWRACVRACGMHACMCRRAAAGAGAGRVPGRSADACSRACVGVSTGARTARREPCADRLYHHRGGRLHWCRRPHHRVPHPGCVHDRVHLPRWLRQGPEGLLLLQCLRLRLRHHGVLRHALRSGLDCHRWVQAVLLCPLCGLVHHHSSPPPRPRLDRWRGRRADRCCYRR